MSLCMTPAGVKYVIMYPIEAGCREFAAQLYIYIYKLIKLRVRGGCREFAAADILLC